MIVDGKDVSFLMLSTPKNCDSCRLKNGNYGCFITGKRDVRKSADSPPEWCPLQKNINFQKHGKEEG